MDFSMRADAIADKMFFERWSPRAFDPTHVVGDHTIDKIVDAARWAPSCTCY